MAPPKFTEDDDLVPDTTTLSSLQVRNVGFGNCVLCIPRCSVQHASAVQPPQLVADTLMAWRTHVRIPFEAIMENTRAKRARGSSRPGLLGSVRLVT